MAHLIDKDALVAEIMELREHEIRWMERQGFTHYHMGERDAYTRILKLLDTLEVKEVDNVWHNANETPKGAGDKEILVQFADSHASVLEIDDWEYLDHQTKWAYLKDLI